MSNPLQGAPVALARIFLKALDQPEKLSREKHSSLLSLVSITKKRFIWMIPGQGILENFIFFITDATAK